jgi:NAD(P)-dependent dehydrogenase (short-subunit alcohol dehydrogenase family)
MLQGKVVIVTGGGNGIGAEICKLAAKYGASVVVNDVGVSTSGEGRNPAVAEGVVDEIKQAGGKAAASIRNVADWDEAHGIVQDALDAFGRVDVVVNNAGILRDTMFHKMTREEFDLVDQVNLRGVFYVARAAAPHFKQQSSGCYVHMTSTSGLIGNVGQVNYGAAKLGVAGLSKLIALDMQKFNVTSNAVAPFAWTRMVATIPETPENRKRLEVNRRLKPDFRRSQQRDLPVQPTATDPQRSHLRWLDARNHRGAGIPRARGQLLPARAVERGVHLGSGLKGGRGDESERPSRAPVCRSASIVQRQGCHFVCPQRGRRRRPARRERPAPGL